MPASLGIGKAALGAIEAHSGERSPGFDTILKVMKALGLKLSAEAIPRT